MIIDPAHPLGRYIIIIKPGEVREKLDHVVLIDTDKKVITCLNEDDEGNISTHVGDDDHRDTVKRELTYDDTWDIYMSYTKPDGTHPSLDEALEGMEMLKTFGLSGPAIPKAFRR